MKIFINIFKKIVNKFLYIFKNLKFFDYISFLKNILDLKYFNLSYSQEGEDMVLKEFLANKPNGFFVDVGAHHPKRFSNTYYFYKLGWNGINIDPLPGTVKIFNKIRPRDINLEIAISNSDRILDYYMFDEPALNGFFDDLSNKYIKDGYKLLDKKNIPVIKLKEVLDEYMSKELIIDFMTIDVEGMELEVLKSNDWEKYSPEILLIEICGNVNFEEIICNPVYVFLKKQGYFLVACTGRTYFFKKNC